MGKFNNKYRIKSNRLQGWDYSSNGFYFITIATHLKKAVFGKIKNQTMLLSKFGEIAQAQWYVSFKIRKELNLHGFILMPNHLHAIVEIYNPQRRSRPTCRHAPTCRDTPTCRDARPCVSTEFVRKRQSISSFVAGFKSGVINAIDDYIDQERLSLPKYNRKNPLWQSNYHDHIIRNEKSFIKIYEYILNNPLSWEKDKFYND